jgi:hypothetical protein
MMVQTAGSCGFIGRFDRIADLFHNVFHSFWEDPVTSRW